MPIVTSGWFNRDTNQQAVVAAMFVEFGNLVAQFSLGKHVVNLELAVTAYQLALQVRTREAFPKDAAQQPESERRRYPDPGQVGAVTITVVFLSQN
jgi:hypothetical protein